MKTHTILIAISYAEPVSDEMLESWRETLAGYECEAFSVERLFK